MENVTLLKGVDAMILPSCFPFFLFFMFEVFSTGIAVVSRTREV